jgi:hypothetical protein
VILKNQAHGVAILKENAKLKAERIDLELLRIINWEIGGRRIVEFGNGKAAAGP